jgi:metal-sulfur cluster biosynthetic enzyme
VAVPTNEQIIEALKPVQDPEIRIGVVDLGLVYDIDVTDEGEAIIKMTLTTPACPYGEILLAQVHRAVEEMDGISEVQVVLVWDPPWNPEEMCSDLAKDQLGMW